jgi:hypothetical protein
LKIEHHESGWFFGISARSGFPLQQATSAVQRSNGVDMGDEVVPVRKRLAELDLEILARLANVDAIILGEALEQLDTLPDHAVPSTAIRIFKW